MFLEKVTHRILPSEGAISLCRKGSICHIFHSQSHSQIYSQKIAHDVRTIRSINTIDDYTRFYHAINYIRQGSDSIRDEKSNLDKVKELMRYSGYAELEKFGEHRKEWDRLERKIPL